MLTKYKLKIGIKNNYFQRLHNLFEYDFVIKILFNFTTSLREWAIDLEVLDEFRRC